LDDFESLESSDSARGFEAVEGADASAAENDEFPAAGQTETSEIEEQTAGAGRSRANCWALVMPALARTTNNMLIKFLMLLLLP